MGVMDKMIDVPGFGFVKKLLEGKPASHPVLEDQFRFLDKVERGLAEKVIAFVLTGEGRTVLATLDARKSAIADARVPITDWQVLDKRNKARATLVRSSRERGAEVGRLMLALEYGAPEARYLYNVGSKAVPIPVQQLFAELNVFVPDGAVAAAHALTFDDLLIAVEVAGGSITDIIDACYFKRFSNGNALTDSVEARTRLLEQEPEAAIAACKRYPVSRQVDFLKFLMTGRYTANPAYRDFLFSCAVAGSSKLRDAAREALATQDRTAVTRQAIGLLGSRKADARTSMVQLLNTAGTDEARAALETLRETEKSADILRLLDTVAEASAQEAAPAEDGIYIAVTGEKIAFAPAAPLATAPDRKLAEADLVVLRRLDDEENAEGLRMHEARQAEMKRLKAEMEARGEKTGAWFKAIGERYRTVSNAQAIAEALNESIESIIKTATSDKPGKMLSYMSVRYQGIITQALSNMAPARAVAIALMHRHDIRALFSPDQTSAVDAWLKQQLADGTIDLRQTMAMAAEMKLRPGSFNYAQSAAPSPIISAETVIQRYCQGDWYFRSFVETPYRKRIWPMLAEARPTILEFLPPKNLNALDNERALELLSLFPALPREALMPVLAAAVGEGRKPRVLAQKLLRDAQGIDDALIGFLADKRQAVRANAAALMGQRRNTAMVAPLEKRLKTETADATRAAIISAISMLGGDTSRYLGKETLTAEAREWQAKLKADDLDWLDIATAPALAWRDGTPVPTDVLDGWLRFAVKLKQPVGNPLFDLYLDQLAPGDAIKLGEWLMLGWLAYDTMRRPRDELQKEALADASATMQRYPSMYGKQTLEDVAAFFLANKLAGYPFSGLDAKGVLALARRAPAPLAAKAIARYLKEHGKRVAQARLLVDLLADMGEPETIQVLVATATRFKQKSVREAAEQLVQTLADERGWTTDELADRSVPTGGLEEGGAMTLEVGQEAAEYTVRLASDLSLVLLNPQGREVKALPAGEDDASKEARMVLADARKTVKTVVTQQQNRLYEAMLSRRTWPRAAWRADLLEHPIVGRLAERMIWRGLNAEGEAAMVFRPTPEGELVLANGDPITLDDVITIDIAHSALLSADDRAAWAAHLTDFEVPALVNQIGRPLLAPGAGESMRTTVTERKGWLMENFKLRGAATKLGYERGPAEDGGSFGFYRKLFVGAGLQAQITFTGSYLPEGNIPVAIIGLLFLEGTGNSYGAREIELTKVPPLILSECWNDYREIAANGTYDEAWRSKGLGYHE
jgi:hypothetical protein